MTASDITDVAAVAETHSATVFFSGAYAYKVKKPVDLGFLDFRTREAREAICHREVELNRRLAPDVYLGVADVTGPDGELCDHMIVMRRMPTDRRLSRLVSAGTPVGDELHAIARVMATFHAQSGRTAEADHAAGIQATRRRWTSNTDMLITMAGHHFDETAIATVHGLACRYLDGRAPLFESRVEHGRAVDGHGDLLADDIFCLDDGPRILDCIEFDDQLRIGDALADVAFLAMDLDGSATPTSARCSSTRTASTPATTGRPRWYTTTSPTEPRSAPRSPPSAPTRATQPPLTKHASYSTSPWTISRPGESGS